MKDKAKLKKGNFIRRQRRTRVKMHGTSEKPRLSVFRSLMHITAQAIDDTAGKTLVAASDKEIKANGNKTARAALVGEAIGKKLLDKKIDKIVFDKGAYKYHGRVKALADGIRKSGVKF